jgi:hypothetical protein
MSTGKLSCIVLNAALSEPFFDFREEVSTGPFIAQGWIFTMRPGA